MKKFSLQIWVSLSVIILLLQSCGKDTPSIVFMPDMYYPVAYDPFQEAVLAYADDDVVNEVPLFQENGGRTALSTVPGTIYQNKEGILPMEWKNTNQDYDASKLVLSSPLDPANKETDLERGKKLYEITCGACHGKAGDGQGSIVTSGAFAGVPNYADREITVGSVYYVIMHGRNAMGSYAGQLNMADRWRVAEYVISEFKK